MNRVVTWVMVVFVPLNAFLAGATYNWQAMALSVALAACYFGWWVEKQAALSAYDEGYENGYSSACFGE